MSLRGFSVGEAEKRANLERTEAIFVQGLLLALQDGGSVRYELSDIEIDHESLGVLFEGTAMGLALLDLVTPWRRDRWQSFVAKEGANHIYTAYVGLGMAYARLRKNAMRRLPEVDPLWQWLVVDGFGFHQGYFQPQRFAYRHELVADFSGTYGEHAFDQGLGRSLWFVESASPRRIHKTISAFPESRQADIWSGLGLACSHAGGLQQDDLEKLRLMAGRHRPSLAQGAAFGAKVRKEAGAPTAHTDLACKVICGIAACEAAALADQVQAELARTSDTQGAYELWRRRIQNFFA